MQFVLDGATQLRASRPTPASPKETVDRLRDSNWVVQEKHDGMRAIVANDVNGNIVVLNRYGKIAGFSNQFLSKIPLLWIMGASRTIIMDGEFIPQANRYMIFDMPYLEGSVDLNTPFEERYQQIEEQILGTMPIKMKLPGKTSTGTIRVTPNVGGSAENKLQFMQNVRAREGEGVVLRDLNAPYAMGGNTGIRKVRYRRRMDAFITDHHGGSVSVAVYAGGLTKMHVGKVSVGGIDPESIEVGNVVEIDYSKLSNDNLLVHPSIVRIRDDKPRSACRDSQLTDPVVDTKGQFEDMAEKSNNPKVVVEND